MNNFVFSNSVRIVFGTEAEERAGAEVALYAGKVLLLYGSGSVIRSGLLDRIRRSLHASAVETVELGGVQPNPRVSLVRTGIELCRREKIVFILALGGGSVIDSAKAIAVGVPYSGDVWDFFERKATPNEALPIGVILTIPASGSEASNRAVISNDELLLKRGVQSDLIRPCFALMNPALTLTLTPFQTACGAVDILSHIMERYFTNVTHVELTDRLCEATMRTVILKLPEILRKPDDIDSRAEVMWAGTLAHNDLLGTGRVGDWASHGIEHELSALYDVPHGAGLAVVLPAWMKHVYRHDLPRFVRFACEVWNVEQDYFDAEETALEGIRRMEDFFRSAGLPVRLADLGIQADRFDDMAKRAVVKGNGTLGNFVSLDEAAVRAVLELCL